MKNKIILILVLLISVVSITACENNKQSDASKFKQEYESLNGTIREKDGKTIRTISIPEDNPFIYTSPKELTKMMDENKTFIVYFGFSDCPWCRSVLETLIKVADDYNIEKIYYVDVKEIRDVKELDDDNNIKTVEEGTKGYHALLKKFDSVLPEYVLNDKDGNEVNAGEKRIYAPNIVAVSNGKPIELTEGISEDQKDGYQKLTKAMKKTMYKKIECLAKCISETENTCTKNAC